jgi:hypothetical protein
MNNHLLNRDPLFQLEKTKPRAYLDPENGPIGVTVFYIGAYEKISRAITADLFWEEMEWTGTNV